MSKTVEKSTRDSLSEMRPLEIQPEELLISVTDMHFLIPQAHDTMHIHNFLEIGFCIEDNGIVQLGWEHNIHYSPGSVVVVPENVPHNQFILYGIKSHWIYVNINGDYLLHKTPARYQSVFADLMVDASHNGLFMQLNPDCAIFSLVRTMANLCSSEGKIPGAPGELCTMLLISMIAEENRGAEPEDKNQMRANHMYQVVEPALIYINQHYRENIHIGELARICAMSESHFRLVFTKCIGKSPLEFINGYRIRRAMHLLRTTSDTAQSIALYAGFPSVATFDRNFRAVTGQSPGEWRRNSEKENNRK